MDPVKILKRAWQILWSYRALWVFGLILALAGAGASGRVGNNSGYQFDRNDQPQFNGTWNPQELPHTLQEAFNELRNVITQEAGISVQELNTLIWIGLAALVFFILLGILTAIARYVAETAVLKMVDEYEARGTKMTVRQGFRLGWSVTSWRLFLINLIINVPGFVLLAILLGAGIALYKMATAGSEAVSAVGIISVIGLVFLSIFVTAILEIFLHLLRQFFWRACALEGLGVGESLSRGWALFRENWKNAGLMWLVMVGLGIAWMVASIILVLISLPIVLVTLMLGAVVAAIPALLLFGLFSTFLSGYLPWIAAILFVLPLFFTVGFSPWMLLTAWETVFTSSVWTLTYREIKAIPNITPPQEIPAAS
jgi:hypothetical protein